MDKSNDENEIFKLSEAIKENDEIITDANQLIKEIKDIKEVDQITFDKYSKQCKDLLLDLDDIIGVIENCQKAFDPTIKSFDIDQKSAKLKAQNSKELVKESLLKLEKLHYKNLEDTNPKKKEISKSTSKKNKSKSDESEGLSKEINTKMKNEIVEEIVENNEVNDNKKEEAKNIENSNVKKKGILKTSIKKKEKPTNKNKSKDKSDTKDKSITNFNNAVEENKDILILNSHTEQINPENLLSESGDISQHTEKSFEENEVDDKIKMDKQKYKKKNIDIDTKINFDNTRDTQLINIVDNKGNDFGVNDSNIIDEESTFLNTNKTEDKLNMEINEDSTKDKKKKSEKSDKKESKGSKKSKKILKLKEKSENVTNIESKIEASVKIENQSQINFKDNGNSSGHGIQSSNESNTGKTKKSENQQTIKDDLLIEGFPSSTKKFNINSTDHDNLPPNSDIGKPYIIIKSFSAEEDDDLSGVEGEEILLIEETEDDWWYVQNSKGKQGYVRRSCIKIKTEEIVPKVGETRITNMKPKSVLKEDTLNESRSNEGTALWNQIKQSMEEKNMSNLLKSFGDLPPGFRYSTLSTWSEEDPIKTSTIAYLCPKLSESHLSCDSQFNQVKIQRLIQIIKVVQLPVISDKFIVKSRHVRLCLFNGSKPVSNIHVMRASVSEKDLKTWNFVSRISDTTKSLDYNEVFLRLNHTSTDLTILMEFCMLGFKSKVNSPNDTSGIKNEETFTDNELIELSIGWSMIPLYENNGQPINNKKGEYFINGGTPFEKGVEIESEINKRDSSGVSKFIMNQNKQPQVSVRIYLPSRENKELLETLPNIIIGSSLNLVSFSFYRRILAEDILDCRLDLTSAKAIYSPFLVSFLEVARHSDLLDILRITWNEKLKTIKSINKKDYGKMNESFKSVYMDYVYPLTKLNDFPAINLARRDFEQIRIDKINKYIQEVKQDHLSVLLTDEYAYSPLTFEELDFHLISKYSEHIQA